MQKIGFSQHLLNNQTKPTKLFLEKAAAWILFLHSFRDESSISQNGLFMLPYAA
ncbi:MAG: hypothetical protein ACLVAW_26250 [Eisenbergiella massiliensis]